MVYLSFSFPSGLQKQWLALKHFNVDKSFLELEVTMNYLMFKKAISKRDS